MSDSPLLPLSKLVKRFREDMKEKGLKSEQFVVCPNSDPDAPTHVQAVITIAEQAPDVQVVVSKDLQDSFDMSRQADESAKAEASRKDLEGLRDDLKNSKKGIGLD